MQQKQLLPRTLTNFRTRRPLQIASNRCSISRNTSKPLPKRTFKRQRQQQTTKQLISLAHDNYFTIECPILNFKNLQNDQEKKIPSNKSIEKRISGAKTLGIQTDDLKLTDFKQGYKIGEGSYSTVKLFYKDNTKYACKIFKKPLSSQMIDAIRKQIQILRTLNHRNIVKLHYYFEETHYIYVVIEYIEGKTLNGILKKQISIEQTKQLFKQIVEGVGYLHSQGISHRDLKFDNIMVEDKTNRIVIIDFGFGTSTAKKLRMFCGTPSYMCPEIVSRSCYYGDKADIWSMGIILYKMITKQFPFKGVSELDVFGRICKSKYVIPQNCSRDLAELLRGMLSKSEQKRMNCSQLLQLKWFQ